MATRLYVHGLSDLEICNLLQISPEVVEAYQAYETLYATIHEIEDLGVRSDLGYRLYQMRETLPELKKFADYKLYGFGRVDPGYGNSPDQHCGGTDSPNQIANLLTQVGQQNLVGKVKALCWS